SVKDATARRGYVKLARTWKRGDTVKLHLPMPVERVHAHPKVKADVGRGARQRGPVAVCLQGGDNPGRVRNLSLPPDATVDAECRKELVGGVVVLKGSALAVTVGKGDRRVPRPVTFQAVPYSAWANRKPGQMIVWLAERPEVAELPGEDGVRARGVRIRASHV